MDKFTRLTADLAANELGDDINAETRTPLEDAEGFGCPFNAYQCHSHCLSIGRRGGYCRGLVRQTCVCYR